MPASSSLCKRSADMAGLSAPQWPSQMTSMSMLSQNMLSTTPMLSSSSSPSTLAKKTKWNPKPPPPQQDLQPKQEPSTSASSDPLLFPTPSLPSFPNISSRNQQPATPFSMSTSTSPSIRPRQNSFHVSNPWHTHDDMCPILHHHHHTLLHAYNPCSTVGSSQDIPTPSLSSCAELNGLMNSIISKPLSFSDSLLPWSANDQNMQWNSGSSQNMLPLDLNLSSSSNPNSNNCDLFSHFDLQFNPSNSSSNSLFPIVSLPPPISGLAPPSACVATEKYQEGDEDEDDEEEELDEDEELDELKQQGAYTPHRQKHAAHSGTCTHHHSTSLPSPTPMTVPVAAEGFTIQDGLPSKCGGDCAPPLNLTRQSISRVLTPIQSATDIRKIGQRRKPTIIGIEQKTPGQFIHGQGDNLFIDARREDGSITCISLRSAPNRCKADLIEALNWMPEEVMLANWRYFSVLLAKIDQSKPFKRLALPSLVSTAIKLRRLNPAVNVPPSALVHPLVPAPNLVQSFTPSSIASMMPAATPTVLSSGHGGDQPDSSFFSSRSTPSSSLAASANDTVLDSTYAGLNGTCSGPSKSEPMAVPGVMALLAAQSQTLSELMHLTQSLSNEVTALRADVANLARNHPSAP